MYSFNKNGRALNPKPETQGPMNRIPPDTEDASGPARARRGHAARLMLYLFGALGQQDIGSAWVVVKIGVPS